MKISRNEYMQIEFEIEKGGNFQVEKLISILPANKKIVLVGGFCSGKNYLAEKLKNIGRKICVSHTDRECRTGEVDGVDYHFTTPRDILKLLNLNKSIQWDAFGGHFYVTTLEEYKKSDVLILSPRGLNKFPPALREQMCVIYLDINPQLRKERYLERKNVNMGLERRIEEEKPQFDGFKNFDIRIYDYNVEESKENVEK